MVSAPQYGGKGVDLVFVLNSHPYKCPANERVGRMLKAWRLTVILVALFVISVLPVNVRAALSVSISPVSQSAPQGSSASYTVSFTGGLLSATYVFGISGLPGSTSYSFSPSTVSAISGSSTLTISTTNIPGLFCPGSYVFTVTVTNAGAPADTGSASASISVAQVGPPLVVGVSSDKATYVQGDTITLQVSVNRPAEGTITLKPPSGPAITFNFQTYSLYATAYTRTLTANQPYGTYTVTVNADDYCNSFNSASTTYTVGPNAYSVSIQLSGVPQQYAAKIQVDGQSAGTAPGSQTKMLEFPIGTTHTVSVDQYVNGDTGVRYYCAQNTLSISSAGTYTFSYQTQYQLTISTEPAGITQVGNGGWLNAGMDIQTGQPPQTIPGSTGVRYVFTNWIVDGAVRNGTQITITMNGPHTAVAKYATQYLLTINSPNGIGNPQGGGYHNAGSTAQFSVTSPQGYLIQQVFVKWQGAYTGTSPQGSVTMDGPKTVEAVWTTSYMNVYLIGGAIIVLLVIAAFVAMRRRGRKATTKESEPKDEETEKKRGLHLGDSDAQ
jgi:hypothetical protein